MHVRPHLYANVGPWPGPHTRAGRGAAAGAASAAGTTSAANVAAGPALANVGCMLVAEAAETADADGRVAAIRGTPAFFRFFLNYGSVCVI